MSRPTGRIVSAIRRARAKRCGIRTAAESRRSSN
jgi:hypothetical protein